MIMTAMVIEITITTTTVTTPPITASDTGAVVEEVVRERSGWLGEEMATEQWESTVIRTPDLEEERGREEGEGEQERV